MKIPNNPPLFLRYVSILLFFMILFSSCFIVVSTGYRLKNVVRTKSINFNFNFDYKQVLAEINISNVHNNIREFVGFRSRVTSYPGYEEAAKFIYDKFVEYGLTNVTYEHYDVAVPYDYGANITLPNGEIIEAYPLAPNLIETCALPPEGVKGRLIYADEGRITDFKEPVNGSIVLLDFRARDRWIYAARYGAKAVIFIERPMILSNARQYIDAPLDFPRLYVSREDGEKLIKMINNEKLIVNVKSRMVYEKRSAKNVIGYVIGTDPKLKNDIVILTSYFDSDSIVPSISPGAEESCGIATLLELARFFSLHKPKRTVMFLALSGHHQGLAGAREFVHKHFNQIGTKFKILINLDISTKSDTLGFLYWSCFYGYIKPFERYEQIKNQIFRIYLPEIKKQLGDIKVIDLIVNQPASLSGYVLESFYLDSEPFSLAGGIGVSFYTLLSQRVYESTPFDVYENLHLKNLKPQVEAIFCILYSILNDPTYELPTNLSPTSSDFYIGGFASIEGQVFFYNITARGMGWYEPVPNALVVIYPEMGRASGSAGVDFRAPHHLVVIADDKGYFNFHGAPHMKWELGGAGGGSGRRPWAIVQAFLDDPTEGPVDYAPDQGKYSLPSEVIVRSDVEWISSVVFKCGSIVILDILNPRLPVAAYYESRGFSIEVLDYETNVEPWFWGTFSWGGTRFGSIIFMEPNKPFKLLIRPYESLLPLGILINSSKENPEGSGFRVKPGESIILDALKIIQDMYWLDDNRLQDLLKYNVYDHEAIRLHNEVRLRIHNALNALSFSRYDVFNKEVLEGWALEFSAYYRIRGINLDVISTTIFYILMLIPFTLLVEKLVTGYIKPMKRFSVIVIIFSLCMIAFYLIHPGLHLASNAILSIIGYVIIGLAVPGILIPTQNIIYTAESWRERLRGAHYTKKEIISTILSVFSIGIENLKKRKRRTILSLTSIILVIFSLISFTSIAAIRILKTAEFQGVTSYNGWFLRNITPGQPVSENMVEYIETLCIENNATLTKRSFIYPQKPQKYIKISNLNGTIYNLNAILGVTSSEAEITEIDTAIIEGAWFPEYLAKSQICIIPVEVSERLNVNVGDTIRLLGTNFTVFGIYNSSLYTLVKDLNQKIVTPMHAEGLGGTSYRRVYHYSPSTIVIIPYDLLRGPIYNLAVKWENTSAMFDLGKQLINTFPGLQLFIGHDGQVFTLTSDEASLFHGWQFIIVPTIIASLSLLTMMLGNIYLRSSEIRIYSILGLNPLYISVIFLAESSLYAIIGGVLGYILGMLSNVVIQRLHLLPPEFTINASSSYVIFATGFGMLFVLLSTIYPAYKSSKMVTPSFERKWKIPTKPRGNKWSIPLPITITKGEVNGALYYIKEHFENFSTERSGKFYTLKVFGSQRKDKTKLLTIIARLSPYEAYIEQKSELFFIPEEGVDRCRAVLQLEHIQGELFTWISSSRFFTEEVRKQLLLWSSLKEDVKKRYMKLGYKYFSSK